MSSPPPNSKTIVKWPFFLADGLCLAVMVTLLAMAERPLNGMVAAAAVCCLIIGMALAFLPYLLEYDARLHAGGIHPAAGPGNQSRRIAESVDKLAQAVSRTQTSAEQIEKVLTSAEESNDRLAELVENLAATAPGDPGPELAHLKEAIAGLEANLVSLAASVGRLTDRPAATAADLDALSNRFARQLEGLNRQPAMSAPTAGSQPTDSAFTPKENKSRSHPPEEENREADSIPPPARTPSTVADDPEEEEGDLGVEGKEAADTARFVFNDESTSLIATAYIGIGNKLFLRGDGPGLSWDEGVPMQFLSIGKWGWSALEVNGPITCRIYKNDDEPAIDGDITIEPHDLKEISPRF